MRMSRTTILVYYIALWISVALSNAVPEYLDGSGGDDDEDFSGSGDGDRSPDVTMSPSSSGATEQTSTIVKEEVISPVTATSPEMAEKTTSEKQETTEGAVHVLVADATTSVPVSTVEASPDPTTTGVALPGIVSDKELSSTAISSTLPSLVDVSKTVPLTSASIIDSDAKPESTADYTTSVSITLSLSSSTSASVNVVDADAKPDDTAGPATSVGTTSASTTSAGIVDFDAKPESTAASNISDGIAGPNKGRKLPVDTEDLAAETSLDDIYLEVATFSETENKVQAEVPQITQSNNHQEAPKLGDNAMSQGLLERKEVLGGVIAGGIIGLAFAVLLVVLMVYRMKKKDEGSYALDDQKHANGGYQKPQKQEEFLA
ncbi:syndecan-1-like [Polyodon spathula]|uniref:syndecan-1-like n=1 Tax=Polyodon spathula TaxID=7913 RepID=UPI001B7EAEA7|nr:syndecan-1-like [Polyodon spathula]